VFDLQVQQGHFAQHEIRDVTHRVEDQEDAIVPLLDETEELIASLSDHMVMRKYLTMVEVDGGQPAAGLEVQARCQTRPGTATAKRASQSAWRTSLVANDSSYPLLMSRAARIASYPSRKA
jgi:hypothetical protein